MSNIEDDIKEIKNFTKASILYGNKIGITTSQHNKLRKAMQNILSEREQDKARIKELEDENRRKDMFMQMAKEVIENSIPKQKVKEILDKAEVMDYYTLPDVINDLQELLGEGE